MAEASISEEMLLKRLIGQSDMINLCMVINIEAFHPNYS